MKKKKKEKGPKILEIQKEKNKVNIFEVTAKE